MIKISIKLPPNALLSPAKLTQVVENALDEAANEIQVDLVKPTGNWEHKPEFTIDSYPGKRIIATDDEIYGYVSLGTDAHYIRAKNVKALHFFRTGFRAKSRVNKLVSNKGKKATKDETFAKGVWHPGTEARNFDTTVQKKWNKEFKKQMQQAIDAAFRDVA